MKVRHRYLIKVTPDSRIRYLRLMRPDNPTHVTDVNQRSIAIGFTQAGPGELKVTMPANHNLVPPAYYMLFAVSDRNVPSKAVWVRIP
jgi:hypothetical protein